MNKHLKWSGKWCLVGKEVLPYKKIFVVKNSIELVVFHNSEMHYKEK